MEERRYYERIYIKLLSEAEYKDGKYLIKTKKVRQILGRSYTIPRCEQVNLISELIDRSFLEIEKHGTFRLYFFVPANQYK